MNGEAIKTERHRRSSADTVRCTQLCYVPAALLHDSEVVPVSVHMNAPCLWLVFSLAHFLSDLTFSQTEMRAVSTLIRYRAVFAFKIQQVRVRCRISHLHLWYLATNISLLI
ncbi:hypothetical protein JOB18_035006 [Solea senegalensis]|uniref:Uncharacterized protein n=1 Tax=Solea senegalensis TaxID=28829 RepID=A0AAV6QZY3_SOLSE|nr:hypothetical protein JOB18_035006 [Solea senegalensis]